MVIWTILCFAALLQLPGTDLTHKADTGSVRLTVVVRATDFKEIHLDPERDSVLLVSEQSGLVARYPLRQDLTELSLLAADFERSTMILVELEGYFISGVRMHPKQRRYLLLVEPYVID